MRLVALDENIFRLNFVEVKTGNVSPPTDFGKRSRLAGKLDLYGFYVVVVDVGVSELDDERVSIRVREAGDDVGEDGIRSDVERDTEAEVGGALEHEAGKLRFRILRSGWRRDGYVELAEHVAWWEGHERDI